MSSAIGGNPWILTPWVPQVTYNRDQVIVFQFRLYRSAVEQNVGNVPGIGSQWLDCGLVTGPTLMLASNMNWLPINATVASQVMALPSWRRPGQDGTSRNAFLLAQRLSARGAPGPQAGQRVPTLAPPQEPPL